MSGTWTKRERLVVVGNGMAGTRTVEELLSRAPGRYDITIIGAEPNPNYNRILLSAVLAGEKTLDEIVVNSRDWYEECGIRVLTGRPVTAIDRAARTVAIAGADPIAYDKLLLATGSKPWGAAESGLGASRRSRLPRHRRCRSDDRGSPQP
jgi:nitrite reductase (NADH) large subunit